MAVTKGTTPTTLGHAFQDSGINFVKVESISSSGRFLVDKLVRISPEAHEALARSKLALNDVLFTIAGTIGRTAIVTGDILPANTNQAVAIVRPNPALVLPRFLRYVLANPAFLYGALSRTVESVQANFSLGELKSASVLVPSLGEQGAIADVLGALDDRIDLLRQTNATLESIAQALFKSWFIDFDPVRAKAEGREPEGMDAATAALFPAEFEASALGLIPKGWRAGALANLSALNAASWTTRRKPADIAYVDLAGVKANVFDVPQRYSFADAPSRARRELCAGDALVGTVRPGNRSFGFIAQTEPGLTASTGFAVLSPTAPMVSEFVYLCVTRDENIDRLAALADGGAYPAVRPELVHNTPCVLPTEPVLESFHSVASPLLVGIAANALRARGLAELRDTLLPRLISGKLRLPDAQALAEAAVA